VVVAALSTLGVTAAPASAHPRLLTTTPQAGYSVAAPPQRIVLVFDEPVTVDPRDVSLIDAEQHPVATTSTAVDQLGRRVSFGVVDALRPGRYIVRWQLTAQDGDVVASQFDFAVATTAAALEGAQEPTTSGFPLVVVLRWLLFAALAGTLGGSAGERLARNVAPLAVKPSSSVRAAGLLGMAASIGLLSQLLVAAKPGPAVLLVGVEAIAFSAVAGTRRRADWRFSAGLGVVVAGAEAARSHLGSQHGPAGGVILGLHLGAAAIWVGALVHLLRVAAANRSGGESLRPLFSVYAKYAGWLVLLMAASGTIGAVLLVPHVSDLATTSYGRLLVGKLVLVAIAIGLAWTGRRRLRRPRTDAAAAKTIARVTPLARFEALTLVAVLAVTATLISVPTPAPVTDDLGYPLPVTGPVLRVGTLVGQIAAAITATENQLELRLRVPDDTVDLTDATPPAFRPAVTIHTADRATSVVALRPCGRGCFTAPVRWQPGTQDLELFVEAPTWHGGTATLPITWPVEATRSVLPRVIAAMRAQKTFGVTEVATSDTTQSAPPSLTVTATADELLESEPYGNTPALETVTVQQRGATKLLLALPAENVYIQLELDTAYRITRETLDEPAHHIDRTFTYSH